MTRSLRFMIHMATTTVSSELPVLVKFFTSPIFLPSNMSANYHCSPSISRRLLRCLKPRRVGSEYLIWGIFIIISNQLQQGVVFEAYRKIMSYMNSQALLQAELQVYSPNGDWMLRDNTIVWTIAAAHFLAKRSANVGAHRFVTFSWAPNCIRP
jgi:hypothetical protein